MQANQTEVPADTDAEQKSDDRLAESHVTIRNHMYAAMGVGLIPVPMADLVGLTGIQVNLIRRLCEIYEQGFFEEIVKKSIATLTGTVVPLTLAAPVFSVVKTIPMIGQACGVLVMPVLGGGATYAVGKVMVQHF